MNETINKLIPKAIQAIKDSKMADSSNVVNKEFKGYISSMGASILQTGLLATIAFYANDDNKKAKSSFLLKAIFLMIKPNNSNTNNLITYVINQSKKDANLPDNVSINNLDFDKLYLEEEKITNALIALKLALRTFKLTEQ